MQVDPGRCDRSVPQPGPGPPPAPCPLPGAGSGRCVAAGGKSRAPGRRGHGRRAGSRPGRRRTAAALGAVPSTPRTPGRSRRSWPFLLQVGRDGREEAGRYGHQTLVTALALGDEHAVLTQTQVMQTQAQNLAATQSPEQHRLDHGPVTAGPQSSQKLAGLVRRQNPRQGVRSADQRDHTTAGPARGQAPRDRIATDVPARDEEGKQAADAGQSTLDRARRQALLPVIRRTTFSPCRGWRCASTNASTSRVVISVGSATTTSKKTLRSNAVANTVFGRTLAVTNRK